MSKKGQGISLNVIIIAAIALLVLVILSIIFIGKMGPFARDVGNCGTKGGVCKEECTGDFESEVSSYTCLYKEGDEIPADKDVGDVSDLKCCIKI